MGACVALLVLYMLLVLPTAADGDLPAASIVDSWGLGGNTSPERAPSHSPHSDASMLTAGRTLADPTMPAPLDSAWDGAIRNDRSTESVDSPAASVAAAGKTGPHSIRQVAGRGSVRGRGGLEPTPHFITHAAAVADVIAQSGLSAETKTTDATTYIDYRNGRIYLSEKPMTKQPDVPVMETHKQKMMQLSHEKMDAMAKRDKTFAATLNKEAKQLTAAGMVAEGTALKREASDLLSKVQKLIHNRREAELDKAKINQRVAEVDKRLSQMKLHDYASAVLPHQKDIAAFREIFKRKQVLAKEKRRVSDGIEIYEYRNGSLWWSRVTNSSILNSSAKYLYTRAINVSAGNGMRFVLRPDSIVLDAQKEQAMDARQEKKEYGTAVFAAKESRNVALKNARQHQEQGERRGSLESRIAELKKLLRSEESREDKESGAGSESGMSRPGKSAHTYGGATVVTKGRAKQAEKTQAATGTGAVDAAHMSAQRAAAGVGVLGQSAGMRGGELAGLGRGAPGLGVQERRFTSGDSFLFLVVAIVGLLVVVVGAIYVRRLMSTMTLPMTSTSGSEGTSAYSTVEEG